NAITELAGRLGKAIADSPAAAELHVARKAVTDHPEAGRLFKEFQDQSLKIAKLESEEKSVEVDDKHKLRDLHEKLIATEEFKKYTAAQVEYADLMRQVSEAIQSTLEEGEKE
ncbi:MAG: YlbF family regulator, partial [Phycisphaerae bacterium]|nr:YlbF family regulator [Phycisphaerae bacterium]